MLHARGITKSVAFRTLFEDVSLSVHAGDRLGVIGPNGAGKSTLLKILAGVTPLDEGPDAGEIRNEKSIRAAFVSQHDEFEPDSTPPQIVADACLGGAAARDEHPEHHHAEITAEIVLGKVGFPPELLTARAGALSGGWRKRLSLAAALASADGEPDLLLLDEPTNHLDIRGLDWLEQFLVRTTTRRPAAAVFVTHDRAFLERTATRIAELSRAYPEGIFAAEGNYTEFLRRKQAFLDAQAEQQRALAGQVRKDLAWLARGPQGRGTKAKGRIDSSHERIDALADLKDRAAAAAASGSRIEFNATARKTRKLIAAKGISKSLGDRRLFSGLDLRLGAGDRLGLLGPNGSGKTTLLMDIAAKWPAVRFLLVTFAKDIAEELRRGAAERGVANLCVKTVDALCYAAEFDTAGGQGGDVVFQLGDREVVEACYPRCRPWFKKKGGTNLGPLVEHVLRHLLGDAGFLLGLAALDTMVGGHMGHFVGQDGSQFRAVIGECQKAARHIEISAGQGKGVDRGRIQDGDLVGLGGILCRRDQPADHAGDHALQPRVGIFAAIGFEYARMLRFGQLSHAFVARRGFKGYGIV